MVKRLVEMLSYAKLNMFLSCKTPQKHCSSLGGILDAPFLKFNWPQASLMKHFMRLLFWDRKTPSNSILLGRLMQKTINNFFKLLFFRFFQNAESLLRHQQLTSTAFLVLMFWQNFDIHMEEVIERPST